MNGWKIKWMEQLIGWMEQLDGWVWDGCIGGTIDLINISTFAIHTIHLDGFNNLWMDG